MVQRGLDAAAWCVALLLALLVNADFGPSRVELQGVLVFIPLAALAQWSAGVPFGLYTGRWRFGSFDEVAGLVPATVMATSLLFLANLVIDHPQLVARSVLVTAGIFAVVAMAAVRYTARLSLEKRRRPNRTDCQRLLVLSAGEGGAQVVTAMLRHPGSAYIPVGLLDDDPAKRNLRICGVPVVGTRKSLASAASRWAADAVLIAIPSADAALITEVSELAAQVGLPVKVLPAVGELLDCVVDPGDIRDVTPADLLGRHEIRTDVASIAGYVTARRVLVTGAGGSTGSELCRQLYGFAPAELIMVDRDESALHAVQLSIEGRALLDSPDLVLLDIESGTASTRSSPAGDPRSSSMPPR